MTAAVYDSNVIVGGAGWRGEAHLCLVAMARRRVRVFASDWILGEAKAAIADLQQQGKMAHDPMPILNWFLDKVKLVTPAPVGKQRSRDPKDDPILGTALAAGAGIIVSMDYDLLDLEKPFGISILRPAGFWKLIQAAR